MVKFDLKKLKLDANAVVSAPSQELGRVDAKGARLAGPFIRGPIPLGWIQRAARLPGGALAVALALWYRSGLRKASTMKISNRVVAEFGVSPSAKLRALSALEQAGLIAVDRHPRKTVIVTIQTAHGSESGSAGKASEEDTP